MTHSEVETERFGERLARELVPGSVVGLSGPLGAAKMTLVRGLARGLGVEEGAVHSPTFITATEYRGRIPLHHIDLYRHEETLPPSDWLAEILDGDGAAVVEWVERLGDTGPPDVLVIELGYGEGTEERRLELRPTGPRAERVVAALSGAEFA